MDWIEDGADPRLGPYDEFNKTVCPKCGSPVIMKERHEEWHNELDQRIHRVAQG